MLSDHKEHGEALWSRFKRGREDQEWYYRGVVESLSNNDFNQHPLYKELRSAVGKMFDKQATTTTSCSDKIPDSPPEVVQKPSEPQIEELELAMGTKSCVIWLYDKAIVVQKIQEGGKVIFLFSYSLSEFVEIGITEEEIKSDIETFIKDKDERTVLSDDIDHYEILNLDDYKK